LNSVKNQISIEKKNEMLEEKGLLDDRGVIRRRERILQDLSDAYVKGREDIKDVDGYYIKVTAKEEWENRNPQGSDFIDEQWNSF
jgi:hypothetical protein